MSAWKAKSEHLILMSLLHGPKHGYDIIKFVEEKSSGHLSLGYGSMYPALHAMEKKGLIKGSWEAVGTNKDKKTYRITAKGKNEIKAITDEFKLFVNAFDHLLAGV